MPTFVSKKEILPMKTYLVLSILIIITFSGCGTNKTRSKLVLADSLLSNTQNDSAMKVIESIDVSDLKKPADEAYYNLLKTQTRHVLYLPPLPDSIINGCIEYYTKHYDAAKLAKAYYYSGVLLYEKDKNEEAVIALKQAEVHAEKAKNKILIHNISEKIAFINMICGNMNTALKYARRALNASLSISKDAWIAEDMFQLSAIFSQEHCPDSSEYYMNKALPYAETLQRNVKAEFYANAGAYFYNTNRIDSAEKYVLKSIDTQPMARTYYILGIIYIDEGKKGKGWELLKKAMAEGNLEIRAEVLSRMTDLKKEEGKYKEAAELAVKTKEAEDSLKRQKKAERLLALQGDIEKKEAVRTAEQWIPEAIMAVAVLLICLIAAVVFHKRKIKTARNIIAEGNKANEMYSNKIQMLTSSEKDNEKEIKKLRRKIDSLRTQKTKILSLGKTRQKEIADGGTTIRWDKTDFEAFIEYFRMEHSDKVNNIECRYSRLTTNNLFFLTLCESGYDDKDIQRIMGITSGALRTIKYRLRKNETEQKQNTSHI